MGSAYIVLALEAKIYEKLHTATISSSCVGLGNEINYSPCTVQLAAERTSVNLLRHTAALPLRTTESLKNYKK
jgi:hypothetical protein